MSVFDPLVSEAESSDDEQPIAHQLTTSLQQSTIFQRPTSNEEIPKTLPKEEQQDDEIEAQPHIQSKITLNASIILTKLPESTNKAIEKLEKPQLDKITIRCLSIGSSPVLNPNVFKISATQQFATIVKFIGKKLKRKEGVFVYLNNSFAPAGDEVVGNLYKVSSIKYTASSHVINTF